MLARLTQFWGSPTGVASTTRELAWPAPGPADSSAADVQAASATASATTRAAGFMTSLRLFRSEEHTSELQSLMRISYAVFCLKKKKTTINTYTTEHYRDNTDNPQQHAS